MSREQHEQQGPRGRATELYPGSCLSGHASEQRRVHCHEPVSALLLHPRKAAFVQQGERGLEGLAVAHASQSVPVDAGRGNARLASAQGLVAQPGVEADGCGQLGRSIEIAQRKAVAGCGATFLFGYGARVATCLLAIVFRCRHSLSLREGRRLQCRQALQRGGSLAGLGACRRGGDEASNSLKSSYIL